MEIAVNRLHFPVTTLGPGQRVGIWLQGCTIGCAGCMSRDTWVATDEHRVEVEEVIEAVRRLTAGALVHGVTISGGEPFEQAPALQDLLRGLRNWLAAHHPDADILCYSGMPWRQLRQRHPGVLELLDAVIPEPYVRTLPQSLAWRGSSNQTLMCVTPLAKQRYARYQQLSASDSSVPRVQFTVDERGVWMIGLPDRGALDAMAAALEDGQVAMGVCAWR